jgi:hypothetical protein
MFVALGFQHATIVLNIFFCGLPTVQYFITFYRKRDDLKNVIEHKMCVPIISSNLKIFSF